MIDDVSEPSMHAHGLHEEILTAAGALNLFQDTLAVLTEASQLSFGYLVITNFVLSSLAEAGGPVRLLLMVKVVRHHGGERRQESRGWHARGKTFRHHFKSGIYGACRLCP